MHTRTKIITAAAVFAAALAAGCGRDDGECERRSAHPGSLQTQIVTAGDMRVAFDFLGKKGHGEMLEAMGLGRKTIDRSDRFVLITLTDASGRKLIMDAAVKVKVAAPDGRTTEIEAAATTGGGMHHYIAGFAAPVKGEYGVDARIGMKGKNLSASAHYRVK